MEKLIDEYKTVFRFYQIIKGTLPKRERFQNNTKQ